MAARRPPTARSIQSAASSDKQPPPPKVVKPPSLARRLLFPHLPPDADLPPLLVSPSATPELNDELYNFIAIALRAYVHPWWTKITRYDKEFLPAITRVLTTVIRVLEARIVKTDLSPLVLRDIPTLINNHYVDYRNAKAKLHTSYAAGGAATLPQLFHQMQPHMAVSAEGTVDEAYIRQALDDVLKICLPPADFEPETERYIIREIMVKVVLGGVIPKVTQPWFIHQTLLNLLGESKDKPLDPEIADSQAEGLAASQRPPLQRTQSHSFSFQSIIIFFLSTIRSVSGACLALIHAYRQARDAIKKVNQSAAPFPPREVNTPQEKPKNTIPGSLVPLSPVPPSATLSTPSPPSPPPSPPLMSRNDSLTSIPSITSIPPPTPPQPNYVHPLLTLLSTLLTPPTPRTLPLALTHLLTLLLTPLTPLLSRLLPSLLYTHALAPAALLSGVRAARTALFPGGYPAAPPPDPTPDAQAALRRALALRLRAAAPAPAQLVLGHTPAARLAAVEAALDPLGAQACNAHLVVFVLDLVLLTLFPEMGAAGVGGAEGEGADGAGVRTPRGSVESALAEGYLTPPRPDSRPP